MKPAAYITTSWDDGDPLDFRVAEMLSRHGLRGTFYIPRTGPTTPMPPQQIRKLSANFEIGAHTLNHLYLPEHPDHRACDEIVVSRKWIEDVTGKACPMFCPPGGKFESRHIAMICEAGYSGFRTVEMMSLDAPRRRNGLLEMPTTIQAQPHAASVYARNIAKRHAAGNLWLFLRHGRGQWLAAARKLINVVLRRGGVFHLWGHSWELEQFNQWNALEEILAFLGAHTREALAVTNGELLSLSH
jgi:peptidoglycan/xylan/chitin deacetylase (PgdA/CDA1 family)